MASLMEELITTLSKEEEWYRELLPIQETKTEVIIKNDIEQLQLITGKEQDTIDKITALERKREEVIQNIATVLNKNPKTLTLTNLIQVMAKQPEDQKKLQQLHDQLKDSVKKLVKVNERNQMLIRQSLEMIEFNMNLLQSTRIVPGSNYTKYASEWEPGAFQTGMFDAKQ